MKKTFFLYLVLIYASLGCVTSQIESKDAGGITLGQVESLKNGFTTAKEVREVFGEAPMQVVEDSKHALIWLYFLKDSKHQRVNLHFDSKSGILQSKTWFPKSNEPENELKSALDRYPDAHFSSHTVRRSISHYIETTTTYDDEKSGISMQLSSNGREVQSISFYLPGTVREYKDDFSPQKKTDYRIIVDLIHGSSRQQPKQANQ